MAFLCPVRIRRNKKKHVLESDLLSGTLSRQLPAMGRITGSASIETLVRVGLEKEHGLSPDSKMLVLHDFTPLVDDELEVHRGQVVNVLYQENDWVYVISEGNQQEGFIPFSYCTPYEVPTFKKKMPRSGPGSVISGGFNEMAVDALTEVGSTIVKLPNGSSLEGDRANLVPSSDFGSHLRASYSPGPSMPVDLASQKQATYNAMLQLDRASTTANLTAAHTTTGPSTAEPSIVSACSNGARSNLSSNPNGSSQNGLSFGKGTLPRNGTIGARLDTLYGTFGKASLMRNGDFFTNDQQYLDSNSRLQLGELQPFFKDAIGRFIVLYPFLARDENEISVERGEVVTLLNKDDPDWCWIVRSDSQEGFVPGLYICPTEMLYNAHSSLMIGQMAESNGQHSGNPYAASHNPGYLSSSVSQVGPATGGLVGASSGASPQCRFAITSSR